MKIVKKIVKGLIASNPKKAFYMVVRCTDCNEEVRVRINRSSDFQAAYDTGNTEHCYTIKKEIIGKNCFNLMGITIALTKSAKVLFVNTKACEFLKFDKE